jgi:hypothetical protein
MDRNKIPHDPRHLGVPSGASETIPTLWYIRRKPCTYLARTLTLSPNGPKRGSTGATSPRTSIGCVQNGFWAYGTFGANDAPI